jgi:PST family polysaccharide transporter
MNEQATDDPGLTKKAVGGMVWRLVGFVALQLGGFGTFAASGHFLNRADVGLVGSLLTVVFWVDVLLDIGMGASLIYEQEAGHSRRVQVAFTVNTMVALVVSGGLLLAAPAVAGFFKAESAVNLFRLIAVLVLIKGLNQIPDALLMRDMQFKRRIWADATRSFGRFGIALAMFLMGAGAEAMVVSVVAAEGAAMLITWFLAGFRPRLAFDGRITRDMLRFGGAVFGSRLLGMLWLNGDYLVVGQRYGGRSREYGDYYTAFRLPELVLGSVYNIFASVAFPMYAAAREVGSDKLRRAALRSLRFLCLFGFAAGVGMSLIARDFILFVFGETARGAIAPMETLGVAGGFVGIGFASGDLYNAIGKPKIGLILNAIGAPILIGGFLLAAPHGIEAIALVHVAVMVPYSVFRIELANRLVGTTWGESLRALRPAALAVVGLCVFALPLRLLLPAGLPTMFAITGAGMVGVVAALFAGDRDTVRQVTALARQAIGR